MMHIQIKAHLEYNRSVPGKCPLPGKHPRTTFQGGNVAASIQTYGIYVLDKHPCRPTSQASAPGRLSWTLPYELLGHPF